MGGISPWQLAIVALIVVLLFGTKKLRTLGTDLGEGLNAFKKAVDEPQANKPDEKNNYTDSSI
ncbi:twin-arginine translocase subunit TatA [Photobacterium sanctipauli]|uniref:Sec-independent protein translocase protein TatA n=2 Tax=Photobacterium sanctipauli TaxID=1342794 RepID=A0A2T3NPD2_9GAMM|nr:twin-arginine translocase TatA/TatE family subunit [Photobacterium sanctipauli]PSW18111.1 twin-arginine translocase subunit TatA [Photobacterium sanctipauli]